MKTSLSRLVGASFIFVLVLGSQNLAFAEQEKSLLGDRFSLQAGWKIWVAKWQTFQLGGIVQATSDTEAFQGPIVTGVAKIRESEWFHSAFANFTWPIWMPSRVAIRSLVCCGNYASFPLNYGSMPA